MPSSDPRPASAVSHGVGIAGLAGFVLWLAAARWFAMDGPYAALIGLVACGVPMVLWSLLVDRVHRNPTTGIDWDTPPRPLAQTREISLVKLAGLWSTWGVIAVVYCLGRWYWDGGYVFAMRCFAVATPFLVAGSIPYVLWLDRRLKEPRDGAYAFGRWLLGLGDTVDREAGDREALAGHVRAWAVKGFFLAFMLSIVPGNWAELILMPAERVLADPIGLGRFLVSAMFLVDVSFATVGYMLTMRPLDAHIRSANPHAAGWTAALMCYPPFIMMGPGGPLDYHHGTEDWTYWLGDWPVLAALVGGALVALTAIYAWATVAFGLRFSNLTHRGILTHGPYAWTRHPAYLSKNAFWWLSTLPFLVTSGSLVDAVRNTATLAVVSGVYWWRARTEEAHLSADPAYRAYAAWMKRSGPAARLIAAIEGRGRAGPVAAE